MVIDLKNKLIIICIILILVGCSSTKINNQKNTSKEITTEEEKEIIEEKYIDNNPIKLGIYMYYNSYTDRKKLTEYTTDWILNVDLCSLEIFYTNEDNIPGDKIKNLWTKYKNQYENIDNYKIGFNIDFDTKDKGHINKNILRPIDTEEIYSYMQIYLYDDINQKDEAWYSHITEEEYNDNSILTSIKLTGSTFTNEITSDIILTVFTYDEDDFDENHQYRGNSKETITIKRK